MSYITRWRKRKAEVDKLLVMNVSDPESEAAIKTATETLVGEPPLSLLMIFI